uniref:Uncharacterized protein n=1 Tax=Brassica oleracea var. oleracea TaxID=109376 RepID=A0A0D3BW98_BRAOL
MNKNVKSYIINIKNKKTNLVSYFFLFSQIIKGKKKIVVDLQRSPHIKFNLTGFNQYNINQIEFKPNLF